MSPTEFSSEEKLFKTHYIDKPTEAKMKKGLLS